MRFPLEKFNTFASELTIQSKESGQIKLNRPNGCQRFFIRGVAQALEEGVHYVVCLKARQLGITTVCAALDLFWHYQYDGTQGTFAAHNEEARDNFRQMLNTYHFGLPPSHRKKLIQNNRYFIAWANRSKLAMQIGGSDKKAGGKGRGLGLSYCHATECSSWNDEESLASILASLAETNPQRLYLFESTARGYNLFHEMWKDAQNAVTQRALFVGWWLNEFYRKEKDSPEYKTYWTGELTPNERDWVRAVKLLYSYDLVPEQIAWWRWLLAEKIHDENLLMQDFPPCVTAETRVGTDKGILRISDARNGMRATKGLVLDTHANRATTIYKMTTEMGYTLRGTEDHPIFLNDGSLRRLKECVGKTIQLWPPRFAKTNEEFVVEWVEGPIESRVVVTEDFARFVGIFMGDGSFQIKRPSTNREYATGVLSIAGCAEDMDFMETTRKLVDDLFGLESVMRKVSDGGVEIRAISPLLTKIMRRLGLVRNDTGATQRKVHVPEFIFRSQRRVVAAFLSGLFETDGFADRNGNRIVLFSKYADFISDVQLLLLAFGITSRHRAALKKSKCPDGREVTYDGHELNLRKEEVHKFRLEIGFLSHRKITRTYAGKESRHTSQKALVLQDKCVSVIEDGFEPVYNLTVEDDHAFDANGILTHNTERHAFILTGQNFFSLSTVDDIERRIDAETERPSFYRFRFGDDFLDTRCEETIENMAHLTIWEMPDPTAHYSIGADPAFGSSDWADAFCLQVYRCYSDRFEQVAEFCTSSLKAPYQFAWIVAAVCGLYRNSRLNLEINGPGEAVQNEINNLRRKASQIPSRSEQMNDAQYKTLCDNRLVMRDVLGMMRYYLYRRLDSPYGGVGAYHTLATNKMKHRMCGALNDLVEKKEAVIHSRELVEEMKVFVREEGSIGAQDRGKDDRVIASSLAAVMYVEWMKIPLEQMGFSYAREMQKRGRFEETGLIETPNETALAKAVKGYMERVGIK